MVDVRKDSKRAIYILETCERTIQGHFQTCMKSRLVDLWKLPLSYNAKLIRTPVQHCKRSFCMALLFLQSDFVYKCAWPINLYFEILNLHQCGVKVEYTIQGGNVSKSKTESYLEQYTSSFGGRLQTALPVDIYNVKQLTL